MANMIVTEFLGTSQDGRVQAAYLPLASQTVAIGATTAATTNALNARTGVILIYAEAACNVVIAAAPNAGTGIIIPFGAGDRDYFSVDPGTSMKVACISRTVA